MSVFDIVHSVYLFLCYMDRHRGVSKYMRRLLAGVGGCTKRGNKMAASYEMMGDITNVEEKSRKKSCKAHCSVPRCTNGGHNNPQLSYHSFPSDKTRRLEWIAAIKRDPGPTFQVSNHKGNEYP